MLTVDSSSPAALGDRLADMLAQVIEVESVPRDAHFFDDLGADSMTMARFCARVRKQPDLPSISMKDVYKNPTLQGLSAALTAAQPASAPHSVGTDGGAAASVERPPFRASNTAYWTCGLVQLAFFLGYAWATVLLTITAGEWVMDADGAAATYVRGVLAGGLALGLACAVPVLAKWILVGRWQETEIRVWSLAYLRLWAVKSLLRISPIPFTAGTPIYNVFLRALGADVGRGAVIVSRRMPLVTDLLTVGPGAVVRRNVLFNGYHAEAGRIRTGRVTIGAGAHVGESAVLGLDVTIGDGARLGHASSLQDGEQVLAGERRDGFGGRHSGATDGSEVEPVATRAARPALFTLAQLGAVVFVSIPLMAAIAIWLSTEYDARTGVFTGSLGAWQTYAAALAVGAVSYVGYLVVAFLLVVSLPRLLRPLLVPGRIYPLYGARYWAQRAIERRSNQPSFLRLVGDSSYVVHYLRAVGYRMPDLVQTGSNFGSDVKHDNPFLTTVGSGTMIADGLSVINVDYSGSSFRLSDTAVGARSFLGNHIVYPPGATVGEDCLLGTKVMVPTAGRPWTGTGLAGRPGVRDPENGASRRRVPLPRRGREPAPRTGRQEPPQPGQHGAVRRRHVPSASPSSSWSSQRRSGAGAGARLVGLRARRRRRPRRPGPAPRVHRVTPRGRSGPFSRSTSRSTTAGSGRTSATGSSRMPPPMAARRDPVQDPHVAAGRSQDRSSGLRRRLRDRREDPDHGG